MDPKAALSNRNTMDLPVNLREGERVLVRGQISVAIFWKPIALLMFAAFLGSVVAINLGIFMTIVAALSALYAFLLKTFLLVAVTNQRVFFRSGLIKIDTVQLRFDKIESVEIQRTILGHFLGYGTVLISGTGTRLAFIPFLENAQAVRNAIDEMLYQRETGTVAQ